MDEHPVEDVAPRRDLRLFLPEEDKAKLRIMFLAKHAKSDGAADPVDGGHATYHHELAQTLRRIGLNLTVGNRYEDLFAAPDYDFLFTLLNRGGFKNSEVFAPTFAAWRGLPCLGATPVLRALGDDKHLMKLAARARGVAVAPSDIHRRGGRTPTPPDWAWDKLVVKPNASSASWGVGVFDDWSDAHMHIEGLFEDGGHDVLVERYVDGIELAVPVIGDANGAPVLLPVMKYGSLEDDRLRTYEEKRGLKPSTEGFAPVNDARLSALVEAETRKLLPEIWPFDYGRLEFKVSPETGETTFLEINMSCNLWSKKTVSLSWRSLGYSHAELVETILCHSLLRQGVILTVASPQGKVHDDAYAHHLHGAHSRRQSPGGAGRVGGGARRVA